MPSRRSIFRIFTVLLFLFFVLPGHYTSASAAQSSAPDLEALSLSFWPEYDRLDVLVMYHIRLDADVQLPAQVRLRLPAYLEGIHALAIEKDGHLLNVDPEQIEWTRDEQGAWLGFPAASRNIQLEYYDPVLLTKQAQTRSIAYTFSAPAAIGIAAFRLQHPVLADEVNFDIEREHEEIEQYTTRDGLLYSLIQTEGLQEGESFEVSISYRRAAGTLSSRAIQTAPPAQAETPSPADDDTEKNDPLSNSLFLFTGAAAASLFWWLREIGRRSTPDSDSAEEGSEDEEHIAQAK